MIPPIHICIAGAIAIATGVGSVMKTLFGAIEGNFVFDLGFVGIPIGYGILIGRSSSRDWALFFSGLGLLLVSVLGVLGIYLSLTGSSLISGLTSNRPFSHPDNIYSGVELVSLALQCAYVFLVLKQRRNKEWFKTIKTNFGLAKSFAWSVAVVSFVLTFSSQSQNWWTKESLERLYPFRVRVIPYNVVTGEGINSLSWHGKDINQISGKRPVIEMFTKVNVSSIGTREGAQLEIHGISTRPVSVKIKAEGFYDSSIIIDNDSEKEERVPMRPLQTGNIVPDMTEKEAIIETEQ